MTTEASMKDDETMTASRIVFLAGGKIYHITAAIPDDDVWRAVDTYDVEHGTRVYDSIDSDGILSIEDEDDDHLYISDAWEE